MEQREVDNMLLSMIQKHFPSLPLSDEHTDWGKWLGFARAVYEAGRASPASVPANFKMVPVEPTMEMCEAGWNEYDLQEHFSVRFMYERMIATANALENIASTSSSTRIRRVANEALKAIRARRK